MPSPFGSSTAPPPRMRQPTEGPRIFRAPPLRPPPVVPLFSSPRSIRPIGNPTGPHYNGADHHQVRRPMAITSRAAASRSRRPAPSPSRSMFSAHTAEMIGLVLACAGLALLVALASYDPHDPLAEYGVFASDASILSGRRARCSPTCCCKASASPPPFLGLPCWSGRGGWCHAAAWARSRSGLPRCWPPSRSSPPCWPRCRPRAS